MQTVVKQGPAAWLNSCAYLCCALLGLYLSTYQSVLEEMARAFSLDIARMGALVAAHFVGSALSPLLLGRLADRRGLRVAVMTALSAAAVGLLLPLLGSGAWLLVAGLLTVGCGYAALEGLMTSALARWNPAQAERAINRAQMWFCVGAVAGPLLSSVASGLGIGWRAQLAAFAVLFGALSIPFLQIPPGRPASGPAGKEARLLWQPLLLLLCMAIAAYVGVEQGIAFFMGRYFTDTGAERLSSWALSSYWAGMILGRMGGSLLKGRHRLIALLGAVAASLVVLVICSLPTGLTTALLFGAIGLLIATVWPTLTAMAAAQYPAQNGAAIGAMMTAGALGGTLFPPLIGRIADGAGMRTAFGFQAALLLAVAGLMLMAFRLGKRGKPAQNQP